MMADSITAQRDHGPTRSRPNAITAQRDHGPMQERRPMRPDQELLDDGTRIRQNRVRIGGSAELIGTPGVTCSSGATGSGGLTGLVGPRCRRLTAVTVLVAILAPVGCRNDLEEIREIQVSREARMRSENRQDHLAEMYRLVERLIELNEEKAGRQILYHLNQWGSSQTEPDNPGDRPELQETSPELMESLTSVASAGISEDSGISEENVRRRVTSTSYLRDDVSHLRDAYLFRRVVGWVDTPQHDDPLLEDWFESLRTERGSTEEGESEQELAGGSNDNGLNDSGSARTLSDREIEQLKTATRLFDWTVRNIFIQPLRVDLPAGVDPPRLPAGLEFEGPGYRQSDYQTLFRGLGDGYQRAGVFTQLCRQAGLASAVLAVPADGSGEPTPWAVGVLIGERVYLFEPELGTFVPGPGQIGIATLTQARREETVVRRLGVPGFFDYRLDRGDVQQSVALLNVTPEAISPRMRRLEQGLTGDRRLRLFVDADGEAERFEAVKGIAGVRGWTVPLLAEAYTEAIEAAAARDAALGFWLVSRWAILESEMDSAETLALGRWRHLQGRFDDRELENEQGARTLYLQQRAPEFEIADLRIDVDLQMQYGIRRELGVTPEVFDRQIQQVQNLIRLGKRTATYWLSLLQYDDGRYDTAENWFEKRVLDPSQPTPWEPGGRYNLARVAERLGEFERAITLYRTVGDPQEHGNRIRARLVARVDEDSEAEDSETDDEVNSEAESQGKED